MRPWSLISLLPIVTSCMFRLPGPPVPTGPTGVTAEIKATVRADLHVAAPEPPVPLQGAPVAEFFGIPLEGAQDVVFVLDCSGSMDEPAQGSIAQLDAPGSTTSGVAPPAPVPRKIEIARRELIDALRRLPAGTRMNVVFFNRNVEAFAPGLVALEDGDRDRLISFVGETPPFGPTALAPGLRIAFLMNARRVVLLSDGLGNVGGDERTVLRDAREAMQGGVRIDAIGLGEDQDAALLQALAGESGGLYQAL